MWVLLLTLPLGGLELLIGPALLWMLGPARWHPELVVAYTIYAAVLLALLLRGWRQQSVERAAAAGPGGDWRWPRGMPAASFAERAARHFAAIGWRVERCDTGARGVMFVLRKDRAYVSLLCVAPGAAVDGLARGVTAVVAAGRCRVPSGVRRLRYEQLKLLDLG